MYNFILKSQTRSHLFSFPLVDSLIWITSGLRLAVRHNDEEGTCNTIEHVDLLAKLFVFQPSHGTLIIIHKQQHDPRVLV